MSQRSPMQRLRSFDSSLSKLKLTKPAEDYLEDDTYEEFLNLISRSGVEYVLIDRQFGSRVSVEEMNQLFKAVCSIDGLNELEIWGFRIDLSALSQALGSAKELRRLSLGFISLINTNNCDGFQNHPSLATFGISDFTVSQEDDYLDSFLQTLSTCPTLERIELNGNKNSNRNPWTTLSMLLRSPKLHHLTLNRLKLTNQDAASLTTTLSESHVEILDLDANAIGDDRVMDQIIEHGHSLRELTIRDNNLGRVPVGAGRRLERLNIARNHLGDAGGRALAEMISDPESRLLYLEAARCGIADDGCVAMANALRVNERLLELSLALNVMTDRTYLAFASALRQNRTLTFLNIQVDRRALGTEGCLALLETVKENTTVEGISTLLGMAEQGSVQARANDEMRLFLRLNHAGRRKFFEGTAEGPDWLKGLLEVHDSLNAIHHLVRSYPSVCKYLN